jgi:hypothetical protein
VGGDDECRPRDHPFGARGVELSGGDIQIAGPGVVDEYHGRSVRAAEASELVDGDERHDGQLGGAGSVDKRGPSVDVRGDRRSLRAEPIVEEHCELLRLPLD